MDHRSPRDFWPRRIKITQNQKMNKQTARRPEHYDKNDSNSRSQAGKVTNVDNRMTHGAHAWDREKHRYSAEKQFLLMLSWNVWITFQKAFRCSVLIVLVAVLIQLASRFPFRPLWTNFMSRRTNSDLAYY